MPREQILYPFTALVGQEQMALALLLNAVNPAIGGLLIRGEKGTAKSTAARALAALLPPAQLDTKLEPLRATMVVPGGEETFALGVGNAGHAQQTPFVELPLGAGDDRVVGTLDLEAALQRGERRFEPGLLARAHGGILYVDEVNLLPDHIVDLLLDVAASGRNQIEREGVSVTHAARFILVGTMNPEEGELRPQFLDRFGLAVDVSGPMPPHARAEVVRRRIDYEADPAAFARRFAATEDELAQRIQRARGQLDQVTLSDGMLSLITHICAESGVDGLRADITLYKSALTLAAWHARADVMLDDVRTAAALVLPHRRRRQPFHEPGSSGSPDEQLDELIRQHGQGGQRPQPRNARGPASDKGSPGKGSARDTSPNDMEDD